MAIEEAVRPHYEETVTEHDSDQHRARTLLGATALILACSAAGGVAGALEGAFTPTGVELGPHSATAQLTLDNQMDYDFGPLGTATKPTGWIAGSGAKVTVKGIPVPPDQSALTTVGTVVKQYEQLFADPEHIKQNAIHTVTTRIWHNAAEGGGLAGGTGAAAFAGLVMPRRRRKRREETVRYKLLAEAEAALENLDGPALDKAAVGRALLPENSRLRPRTHRQSRIVAIAATLLVGSACGGEFVQTGTAPNPAIDHVLDGTPFAGYAIQGEWLRLAVDEGASRAKAFIENDQAYYKKVSTNFEEAFQAKFGHSPLDHKGRIYLMSVSDDHCNVGNYRVESVEADAFQADAVINSGDLTNSGLAIEEECVGAQADDLHAHTRPEFFAGGNHDSPTIEDIAKKYGMVVLHMDKAVTFKGLTILGEDDVEESTFGTPIHLRGTETIQQETNRLTKAACELKPTILVVHEPEMATPAVEKGCTSISISGHLHNFHAPAMLNATGSLQMVEGTSGGAKENSPTIGTLLKDAVTAEVVLDEKTRKPLGYYKITEHPDTTVDISDFIPMPTAP